MNSDRRTDRPGQGRDARLGAALRANLARRKAQARARAAGDPTESTEPQDGQPPNPAASED